MSVYCVRADDSITGSYLWLVKGSSEDDAIAAIRQLIGPNDHVEYSVEPLESVLAAQYRGIAELHTA